MYRLTDKIHVYVEHIYTGMITLQRQTDTDTNTQNTHRHKHTDTHIHTRTWIHTDMDTDMHIHTRSHNILLGIKLLDLDRQTSFYIMYYTS